MEFIATFWWVWLIGWIATFGYIGISWLRKAKGMMKADSFNVSFGSFFAGMGGFVIAFIPYAIFSALLVIAVIIHLVKYLT